MLMWEFPWRWEYPWLRLAAVWTCLCFAAGIIPGQAIFLRLFAKAAIGGVNVAAGAARAGGQAAWVTTRGAVVTEALGAAHRVSSVIA